MNKKDIPPFEKGQRIICIEIDPEAMKNSSLKEKIINGKEYEVSDCEYDSFLGEWSVKVDGTRTEWDVKSFKPFK